MPLILFSDAKSWPQYADVLPAALLVAGVENCEIVTEVTEPSSVDYIVHSPAATLSDFTPYTNTKLVQNLWAGVERITGNETLSQPLARMVESGLVEGMVEWVIGHTLRYHLGMDAHIVNPDHKWISKPAPLARERTVAVLGLGELGQPVAAALAALRFRVVGWSRTPKSIPDITTHCGDDGLVTALRDASIVVLLLPATSTTANIINASTIAMLPPGAVVINAGRGILIDDDALLAALDCGHLAGATLDVFRTEPLPEGHPYWTHPRVTVTPHISAATRPSSSSAVVAENIRRGESREPYLHLVDRGRGY